jgi:hypothetical protein
MIIVCIVLDQIKSEEFKNINNFLQFIDHHVETLLYSIDNHCSQIGIDQLI